jgi:hypothetical protein
MEETFLFAVGFMVGLVFWLILFHWLGLLP